MVIIGASPFVIDMLTVTGKFIARPLKGFNQTIVMEFDEKMKQYVKNTFSVEDPNALLAETLPERELRDLSASFSIRNRALKT